MNSFINNSVYCHEHALWLHTWSRDILNKKYESDWASVSLKQRKQDAFVWGINYYKSEWGRDGRGIFVLCVLQHFVSVRLMVDEVFEVLLYTWVERGTESVNCLRTELVYKGVDDTYILWPFTPSYAGTHLYT